jgi:hypothetical protein
MRKGTRDNNNNEGKQDVVSLDLMCQPITCCRVLNRAHFIYCLQLLEHMGGMFYPTSQVYNTFERFINLNLPHVSDIFGLILGSKQNGSFYISGVSPSM